MKVREKSRSYGLRNALLMKNMNFVRTNFDDRHPVIDGSSKSRNEDQARLSASALYSTLSIGESESFGVGDSSCSEIATSSVHPKCGQMVS